jgi:hypothetical protein
MGLCLLQAIGSTIRLRAADSHPPGFGDEERVVNKIEFEHDRAGLAGTRMGDAL